MNTKKLILSTSYILWGVILVWGVVFADNTIYPVISTRYPHVPSFVNDTLSKAVMLFVAFMPVFWAPKFFGYQIGSINKHWKLLLGMGAFFVVTPLLYRLILGETPFGANTWFFEGVVVPLEEEGFFRGILLSMLLWGFGKMYPAATADWLAIFFSTLIFSTAHLNNLGEYPSNFILFQVGFSTVLGFAFGYARVKTGSIYPAILLHALFNLAGTV
ncbi:MAG TPA: CPBP family intramembrane glutamic endopeptidase [Anaerolineales bacterium]|nr:CPBP family intramembrane glutamic endopeptidase [Anaerolineales bacterium]